MNIPGKHNLARGFSLLEVLIAVVIMSVGLLALASLQISIVRASSEAKTQTVALNLALDKLEDLITYRTLNRTANTCAADSTDSYQCIDTDATGEQLTDTSGVFAVVGSGGTFTRTWTVDRCVGLTGEFTCAQGNTAAASSSTPRNEFKNVLVDVAWVDAAGVTQHVTVRDAVGAIQPSDAALISKKPIKLIPRYAQEKIYNPASEAGVIPIAVGNDTSSAATNPKPEVIVGNSVVETRFDVLTYSGLVSDTTVTAQARVETAMVGCTCDFSTAPASNSTDRARRPAYWDGFRYVVPDTTTYVPKAGVAAGATQSSKCDICCRDHHDPTGSTGATFSPLRVAHPTVSAAHPHYYTADGLTWTASTTGPYQDACRLVRVDGIFRVAPDLANDYYAMLATGDGTQANTSIPDTTSVDGTPSTTGAVSRYQKFVLAYLGGRFTAGASTTTQATYNTVGTPYTLAISAPYVLDNPTLVEIPLTFTTGKWLHARGLYIDYLETDAVTAINNAKDDPACTGAALSACILKLLPFTTINLTELGDWVTGDATRLAVTNNDFSTSISSVDPVRGKVTSAAPDAANPVNINTVARLSNTGLLDLTFNSISVVDNTTQADAQAFNVTGGSSSSTKHVTVKLELPNPYGTAAATPVSTPNSPAVNYYEQSVSASTYACGLPTSSSGTVSKFGSTWYRTFTSDCAIQGGPVAAVGVANGLGFEATKYNFQYPSTGTATINGCTYAGINPHSTTFGTENYNPGSGVTYPTNKCYNFALGSVTVSPAGATSNSPGTVASDGLKAEGTKVNFSMINENDVITLHFDNNPTTTTKLPSCTYTCTLNVGQTACASGPTGAPVFTIGSTAADCN